MPEFGIVQNNRHHISRYDLCQEECNIVDVRDCRLRWIVFDGDATPHKGPVTAVISP